MDYNLFTFSRKGLIHKSFEIFKNDVLAYSAEPQGLLANTYKLYDEYDQLLLGIRLQLFHIPQRITFEDHSGELGTMSKNVFSNLYKVETQDASYEVKGNIWSTQFDIFKDDLSIAKASRKILRNTNMLGLGLIEGVDEDLIVAMIIGILMMKAKKK